MVPRGFAISLGGVLVPSVPTGMDFGEKIFLRRWKHTLFLNPKYDVDSEH
jgi:hypothetical protein